MGAPFFSGEEMKKRIRVWFLHGKTGRPRTFKEGGETVYFNTWKSARAFAQIEWGIYGSKKEWWKCGLVK